MLAAMGRACSLPRWWSAARAELLSIEALTERAADRPSARRAVRAARCARAGLGRRADSPAQEALQELRRPMPSITICPADAARTDLLLLVCIDRQFGDLSASRWQAAVARHQGLLSLG
ncbi:MAG: hypothetical protein U1F21_05520 [Sphaerotilus natans]